MKVFRLKLPSCNLESVGFSGDSRHPSEKLNLSFRASKSCVDGFLMENNVKVSEPLRWPFGVSGTDGDRKISPTRPPFPENDMKRFGWNLDPSREYNFYGSFRTSSGSTFEVLVDPRDAIQTVYMVSTNIGNK